MHWTDLDPRDLFDWSVSPGTHRLAGVRAVVLDAGAFTILPSLLADAVGQQVSPRLLRDLGYAQGWLLAHRVRAAVPVTTIEPWPFLAYCTATLGLGHIVFDDGAFPGPVVCRQAFETEHVVLAPAHAYDAPACHRLAGFISGVASAILDRIVLFEEQGCVTGGLAYCRFAPVVTGPHELALLTTHLRQLADRDPPVRPRAVAPLPTHGVAEDLGLGAQSPQMREVMTVAAQVAGVDLPVLITGESGVGKERIAEFLHEHSMRARRPYVPVNCAAIPEHLLESELFGHRRGAFTGATEDKQGLFEAAHGGTLFLDEVGELSLPVQAKLLRVLQDHNIRRLGDTTHRHVDVRIVAATNRDLRQEIAAQRFREDLFYRLNGVELRVPALRERPEDLRYLVRSLLTKAARSMKRPVEGYTPDALDALLAYRWPGNIRELENAIDRACALAVSSRIELAHLPDHVRHAPALPIAVLNIRTLRDIEREHILTTLQAVGGNRKRAAELLQIPLTTFFRKLRKLRITAQLVDRAIQNGTAVPD